MGKKVRQVPAVPDALPAVGAPALAQEVAFPVAVSENGRYFVDGNGTPVFWIGTTQWQLFREYTPEEARTILERTAAHGFRFVQVMLLGVGDGTQPNVSGQKPWLNDDPLTPNEEYFRDVDTVVRMAGECNLAISMTIYHQRYRERLTPENARAWAHRLATRYRDVPQIVWSMTPRAEDEYIPVLRELAVGLHEGDGGNHLITFKPDPSPYSSSFIHDEDWLDFNSMQTWADVQLICPMVTHDYNLRPVKPVLMAEGAYEAGSEYGFEVSPLWVRRQAYYSYLAGAHHTYGHNDSWRVLPTWREALDAPGAVQMGILKRFFMARPEWWLMVPDQSILASGGRTDGRLLHLAARHRDGRWAVVYLSEPTSFSVNLDRLAGSAVSAVWVNPETGDASPAGSLRASGTQPFSSPDHWADALLVLDGEA
ncbi:MAG: DUF4038 domain-containing protein [Candidatus Brocadiaceae bacterium]|nr:DUF4038 domain-containing protein [Candidatus Brocadiaceae bacterium]